MKDRERERRRKETKNTRRRREKTKGKTIYRESLDWENEIARVEVPRIILVTFRLIRMVEIFSALQVSTVCVVNLSNEG